MDLLKKLSEIKVNFSLDNIVVILMLIVLGYLIIKAIYNFICNKFKKKLKIVNMNINIANIGSIDITVDSKISKIAHDAWIEIMTRKVGIEFEEDKDVIVEVYDSWYKLFGIIRDLLKEIELLDDKNVKKLENVLLDVLNQGLRPHLTTWQAKFRRWYNNALQEKPDKTPQEIQKEYSEYNNLIADLKNVNQQMLQFADELKKLF